MSYYELPGSWGRVKPNSASRLLSPQTYAGRWLVTEKGGATTLKDIARRNDGTLFASVTFGSSKFSGRALDFSGGASTSVLTIADDPSMKPTAGITLAAWVFPRATTSYPTIIDNESGTTNGYVLACGTSGDSALVRIGGTLVDSVAAGQVVPNRWTFLCATYDGANITVYVNGCECAKSAKTGAIAYTGVTFAAFGRKAATDAGRYNGLIDNVSILQRALSPNEVFNRYEQPFYDIIAPRRRVLFEAAAAGGVFIPIIGRGPGMALVGHGGLVS